MISVSVTALNLFTRRKNLFSVACFHFIKSILYNVHWEKESVWQCLWFMPSLCSARQVPTCPRLESTHLSFVYLLKSSDIKAWILFKENKIPLKDYEKETLLIPPGGDVSYHATCLFCCFNEYYAPITQHSHIFHSVVLSDISVMPVVFSWLFSQVNSSFKQILHRQTISTCFQYKSIHFKTVSSIFAQLDPMWVTVSVFLRCFQARKCNYVTHCHVWHIQEWLMAGMSHSPTQSSRADLFPHTAYFLLINMHVMLSFKKQFFIPSC